MISLLNYTALLHWSVLSSDGLLPNAQWAALHAQKISPGPTQIRSSLSKL